MIKGYANYGRMVRPNLDGAAVLVEARAQVGKDTTIAPSKVRPCSPGAMLLPAKDVANLLRY